MPWKDNKLAIVEREEKTRYVVNQYLVQNNWQLRVGKNPGASQKWKLERICGNKAELLRGKSIEYDESKSKVPKEEQE